MNTASGVNFRPAKVTLDGVVGLTVEHAYQAAKSVDADAREPIAPPGGGGAKRAGQVITSPRPPLPGSNQGECQGGTCCREVRRCTLELTTPLLNTTRRSTGEENEFVRHLLKLAAPVMNTPVPARTISARYPRSGDRPSPTGALLRCRAYLAGATGEERPHRRRDRQRRTPPHLGMVLPFHEKSHRCSGKYD